MVDRLECRLYRLVAVLLATSFIAGLLSDGPQKAFADFLSIQISGARLINDFTSIGIGGALLNASSVAAIGLLLVRFADVRFGSPTLAAVFTMWGFGFFGKTPLNILPIMAGVWMVSVLIRKTLGSYSLVALFGTALGPLVTFIIFETSMPLPFSIPVGILCGIVTGMLLPAIASALLQFHQGYNLYNVGFACGFLGLFLSSILKATGTSRTLPMIWNTEPHPILALIVPTFSCLLIVMGFIFDKKRKKKVWHEF